jgi:hypothetical protein
MFKHNVEAIVLDFIVCGSKKEFQHELQFYQESLLSVAYFAINATTLMFNSD